MVTVIESLDTKPIIMAAGAVTFVWYPRVRRLQPIVLLFDAAGLGLFAVAGTQKALAFGVNPIVSALLGMLTGIGGGVVRDLLVNEIPVVLRADLYALAALAGAALVVGGHLLHWPPTATTISGAILCFGMRLIAIRRGWNLPSARLPLSSGASRVDCLLIALERSGPESFTFEPGSTRNLGELRRIRRIYAASLMSQLRKSSSAANWLTDRVPPRARITSTASIQPAHKGNRINMLRTEAIRCRISNG